MLSLTLCVSFSLCCVLACGGRDRCQVPLECLSVTRCSVRLCLCLSVTRCSVRLYLCLSVTRCSVRLCLCLS